LLDNLDSCISRLGDQPVGRELEGRTVFFPWGLIGRGYVLDGEDRARRVRLLLNREHVLLVPTIILIAVGLSWRAGLAAAAAGLVVHAVAVAMLLRGSERVERTFVQALAQVADGRWRGGLWLKAVAAAAVAVYGGGIAYAGFLPRGIVMAAGFGLVAAIHFGALLATLGGR
jgi:hypothetical protein